MFTCFFHVHGTSPGGSGAEAHRRLYNRSTLHGASGLIMSQLWYNCTVNNNLGLITATFSQVGSGDRGKTMRKEEGVQSGFLDKIDKTDGCWVWCGTRDAHGYGRVVVPTLLSRCQMSMMAHRISYEYFVGEIPDGLVIDHLCNNTSCVNPDHLEPKTIYENARRGFRNGISGTNRYEPGDVCRKGLHIFTSESDLVKMPSERGRRCKKCLKERVKRRYRECKASINARRRELRKQKD